MIFIDVYGESAHFKSHFQNSSNISYSYFPRTAAIGFLAAILRYEHDSYHEDFADGLIGVSILNPVFKESKTINWLNYGSNDGIHSQQKIEYIKSVSGDVGYRIYYCGALEQSIIEAIEQGNGYLLYLGVTECLAQIDDFGAIEEKQIDASDGYLPIETICPQEIIADLDFESMGNKYPLYEKTRVVYSFSKGRISNGIVDIISETSLCAIKAKLTESLEFSISQNNTRKAKLFESKNGKIAVLF